MATSPSGRGEPVAGAPRADAEVALDVRRALAQHLELQRHPVEVSVSAGQVELRGVVPNAELRLLAGELAVSVAGVRGVANHVMVAGERD